MRLVSRALTETKLKAFLHKHLARELNVPPWHHTLQHGTGSYDVHRWYGRHLMVLEKQANLWFLQFLSGLHCLGTKTDIARVSDHLLFPPLNPKSDGFGFASIAMDVIRGVKHTACLRRRMLLAVFFRVPKQQTFHLFAPSCSSRLQLHGTLTV